MADKTIMKLSVKPDENMTVKVIYTDKDKKDTELLSADVVAGKSYDWDVEIPHVTGTATVYLVINGEWGWAGSKDYTF